MPDTGGSVDKRLVEQFEQALLSVDRLSVKRILGECKSSLPMLRVLEELLVPAMERIGKGWELGTVALSQVYMSGRICEELLEGILPADDVSFRKHRKTAIAVLNDRHMLGKRIVCSVLRAGGFRLLDYGTVDVENLVNRVKEDHVAVLLISTLMLHSALRVKEVGERLHEAGCRVKLVVGGAPFRLDRQLWREVGADAVGYNGSDALAIVAELAEDHRTMPA